MARAVIMAGGQGERFWPLTSARFPKYRIRFENKRSLLQNTYARLRKVFSEAEISVVTTRQHEAIIRKELPRLKAGQVWCEPFRNNTACAILYSAAKVAHEHGPETVVSFYPADHLIRDEASFKRTIAGAIDLAKRKEVLVALGIAPDFPATAYGYIEAGPKLPGPTRGRQVRRFVEKPDRRTAELYLRKGNFYWNGGIFVFRSGVFLETMDRFAPQYTKVFDLRELKASYRKCPSLSIDYALLEKADNLAVYPATMDWCDIGGWQMLWARSKKDAAGNHVDGDVRQKECQDSLILNHTARPVAALGLKRMIVAQSERGLLICPAQRSDEAALLARRHG